MWLIRPSATTTLTAVSSSPARSIRTAGAPFSHTGLTTASGVIVLKRERRVATWSRPSTGRRKAATSPPPSGHVFPGPVGDLPDRTRRLVDRCSDVGVRHLEDLAQHEDRPFCGREGLQHGQHRDRDTLGELDVLGHVRRGGQRLGQPLPNVFLAPSGQRPHPVERLAGDYPQEVGAGVAHFGALDVRPPQPGLLDHVLGVGGRAEHLVGDGEQQAAVGYERVVGHVGECRTLLGLAKGFRSQATENSCDSMPKAVLVRVYRFASPMNAVSSTSADAPSASNSRADISSVTVGGVWLIASAYSMTSRSSGVKTSDSRQRGTSRALVRSSPSLWAWK